MTFSDCVSAAIGNPEFVKHWARLRNVRLPTSGIERAIDDATGYNEPIARLFLADVYDLIFTRLDA